MVACYALTGDMDYLLHVVVQDLEHFSRFLLDNLLNASGMADVNSSFVLRAVKTTVACRCPVPDEDIPCPRRVLQRAQFP